MLVHLAKVSDDFLVVIGVLLQHGFEEHARKAFKFAQPLRLALYIEILLNPLSSL